MYKVSYFLHSTATFHIHSSHQDSYAQLCGTPKTEYLYVYFNLKQLQDSFIGCIWQYTLLLLCDPIGFGKTNLRLYQQTDKITFES